MSMTSTDGLERRTIQCGLELLDRMRKVQAERPPRERWLENLRDRIMDDERFRVQALRFVDVLPALHDDREVVQHLREYFGEQGLPLTGLVSWGIRHASRGVADMLIARATRQAIGALARRHVGGADATEALETLQKLRQSGKAASVDLLGEAVISETEAEHYFQRYRQMIGRLAPAVAAWPASPLLDRSHGRVSPRLNLSLKLSALYPHISAVDPDSSVTGIAERLRPLLRQARQAHAFVCLDMEQYDFKHVVLAAFKQVLAEGEFRDWPDVGIALQAYLRDTVEDVDELIHWAGRRGTPVTVRLVRGAYWDYETVLARQNGWPVPVYEQKNDTDANYERLVMRLLSAAPTVETAIGTHNPRSMALAMAYAEQLNLPREALEFQMLYGMAEPLEDVIRDMGYRLRVYLPCGDLIPGMAYLVRRLLENASSQSFQRLGLRRKLNDMEVLAPPRTHPAKPEPLPTADDSFRNEPPRRFVLAEEREAFAHAIAAARQHLGARYDSLVAGETLPAAKLLRSINPAAPEELIGEVGCASARACDDALRAARKAQPAWAKRGMEERATYLRRIAMMLRARRDEFAAWEILEAGKTWREADADVIEAIDFLEYYAEEAVQLSQSIALDRAGETNVYHYRPRGVGVVIPPWNFPLAIMVGMLSAAIVAGNTVVVKPSSQTPVIAARFMTLVAEADVPPGVVNLLFGSGGELGDLLIRHRETDFISFTGSLAVGRRIIRLASAPEDEHASFKTVIAEMGGKNAIVIDSDADLDDAVPGVLASAFGYQGQKCSAASRVVVVGAMYEGFIERVVEAARTLRVGAPWLADTDLGPVIEASARDRILQAIASGRDEARLVLAQDVSYLGPGYYLGPTIYADVPEEHPLAQEEIFGPVLSILPAVDFEDALRIANGTRYALTGGVYSRSPAHLGRAREAFQVGNLYLNRKITGALVGHHPFGGFKHSGLGDKAGGPDTLLRYMIPRCVTENTLRRGFAPGEHLAHTLGVLPQD